MLFLHMIHKGQLTYSQVDMEKVPDTATFAQLVLEARIESTSSALIFQEPHADGDKHHLIMKLIKHDSSMEANI